MENPMALVPLVAMVYLLLKHFVCDFPIQVQTPWMFQNKGTYGHPAGVVHSLIHSFATLPLLLFFAWNELAVLLWVPALFIIEFLVHYHMDWFKMWWCAKKQYKPDTHPQFWTWLGIDQLVHGLTYVGILVPWFY
jgi:hypothetical protein